MLRRKHSNKAELWQTVQEWGEIIPLDNVQRLLRRCAAVIAVRHWLYIIRGS